MDANGLRGNEQERETDTGMQNSSVHSETGEEEVFLSPPCTPTAAAVAASPAFTPSTGSTAELWPPSLDSTPEGSSPETQQGRAALLSRLTEVNAGFSLSPPVQFKVTPLESTLSPPHLPGSSSSNSAPETSASLLPGLPEDLAWSILLRVPCSCIHKMRRVCHAWRSSIPGHDNAFFQDRARTGVAEPWLYVSVSDWQGSNACFAWEPSTGLWHKLPPIPGSQCRNVLTLQFAAVGGKLVVSGMVERDNPMDGANGVYVYEPHRNQWRKASPISTGRWFCMSGVVQGRLFVAGGIGTCNSLSLVPTVESYSVHNDSWEEMACTKKAELMTLPGYQAVLDNKLYAKNIGWGPRLGICYDPLLGDVQELSSAMVQGWQGPTTAVDNRLVIVDFGDSYRVKAWDQEAQKWAPLGLLRLPAEGHKPWAVQLTSFMGKLCLVLPNLTFVTVPLSAVLAEPPVTVDATVVEVKRNEPAPASSGPEPSVLTSAVLGCQVLMM